MAHCENLDKCRFFNETLADTPAAIVEGYKSHFCRGVVDKCARRIVSQALGSERVPVELGPHESTRALELLRDAGQGSHAARLFL